MSNPVRCTKIENVDYIYAPDAGINPDTGDDLSLKLSILLSESNATQKTIYFPEGTYIFSEDILLQSYNSLKGSTKGTIFRGITNSGESVMFGDNIYVNTVKELSIENIIFDNARVHFYGRKTNISISHNVFINTITDASTAQLNCSTNAYTIKGNIFMRGRGYAGVGISTYGNAAGLIIEQNFLGSVSDIALATPWLDEETQDMLALLLELRDSGLISFDDAQGDFVAGWHSTSFLKKGLFRRNFFVGSKEMYLYNPLTNDEDIGRDHNVYIKQYEQVEIVENYFGGWPGNDSASGQLKFRNAKGLVFAANHLKDISFNARPYDSTQDEWLIMQNTFIFNNYIDNGMISYWQNFIDSEDKAISIESYLVFDNLFTERDTSQILISSPEKTLSFDQFLCAENRYVNTGELVQINGVFRIKDLEDLKKMLPEYAYKYVNAEPIMPY